MRGFFRQICWIMAAVSLLTAGIPPAFSQPQPVPAGQQTCSDSTSCLKAITTNTYATLQSVNNVPTYLYDLTRMALSWLEPDKSDTSTNMMSQFSTLGSNILSNQDKQIKMQQQLIADMYNVKAETLNDPNISASLPIGGINDISFMTIMGMPPMPKVKSDPYNYLKNISGFAINHTPPLIGWTGTSENQKIYGAYYHTLMAIQSFNAYILSDLYVNSQSGNGLTSAQNALVSQASDSQWLATIGGEELGKVLRQILMFNSQSYILLTELLRTERQLLAAQTINNTLQILTNMNNEKLMLSKAISTTIQP
ncbi:MAG: hypothetical protein M1270_06910 [Gammaproteobacteria bacterium]|nr:hypothetical protein [Gammaproteobacteria bacterium]